MPLDHHREDPTAIRTNLGAIFASLELSRSTWLITSLAPGGGEKMSKHSVPAGNIAALLARFSELQQKALARTGKSFPIIVIQEAGLDGFWIHRVLQSEGIESYVVDPASIATSRRRRRAKTDRIDGEALVRALLAYKRGEPRVCAMVRAPTPEDEDSRRLCRERKTPTVERIQHVNRIKGLLFSQGVSDYEPLRRNRRQRLDELKTGDGRPLPPNLKAQISRELDRLELLIEQIKAVENERDALVAPATKPKGMNADPTPTPQAMLMGLKGIGTEISAVIWSEGLYRSFANRKQVAAYAGLAPTPWQSGSVAHEQGVSKAGNPRLRTTMIQLSWLWLQHQPQSALAQWFKERVKRNGGRLRKTTIVALARKLLVALWKYVTAGVVIEGAIVKSALNDYRKRSKQSTETRSVSADPGGRIAWPDGFNSRNEEWFRPPEPRPPQAGSWCSRFARRPHVSLIWRGNDQIYGIGLGPWIQKHPTEFYSCATKSPLTQIFPCEPAT